MIDFLIKSTLSLIVFLGFYYLVLEREKMYRFNRFYLLISVLFSLLFSFISYEVVEIIEIKPIVENIQPIPIQAVASTIKENIIKSHTIPQKESINYAPFVLWSLYGLVAMILFVRFGKNIWKLISKSKSNSIVKYENAKLVLVQEETLPYSFLNYIFLNADDYHNNTIEKELYTHELVHVNQKHTLDILGIELIKCVFWFNPIFYFYKKAIQLNHEFLADEKVVNSYNNVPFYQNLLLNKCSSEQAIYLTSNINYLVTKKRLIMMTKTSSKIKMNILKIIILPVVLLLIYSFCIKKVSVQKDLITVETKIQPIKEREVKYLTYKVSDEEYYKDVVCVYYECVDVKIKNPKNWPAKSIVFSKKYQELSKNEIEKLTFLKFRQEPTVKKSPTQKEINNFQNSKKYAICIDGVFVENSKLNSYKLTDFACFSGSVILKNARTKKHPQPFQYWFHTQKYYKNNNMDKWMNRYPGDSIVMATNKINSNLKKEKKIIVIDAGHGGNDSGANINDELESKIVESLAKKIKLLNVKEDIEIVLLREDDSFIALSERVNKINEIKPSLVISLHLNASKNINENGVNAYVSSKNEFYEKSLEGAGKLIDKISNNKLAKGSVKDANLFIIKNSKCPAVLLEVGYLSNENDKAYITSENGKNEIANRIFQFLKQY